MWIFWTILLIGIGIVAYYRLAMSTGKTPVLPKFSGLSGVLTGSAKTVAIVVAKVIGTAVIVLLVYLLPSLMKGSMPGKALLSALGSQAGWYEWVFWIPGGIIATFVIQKIWRKAAAGSKPAGSNMTWWILVLIVMLLVAALSSMVTEKVTVGNTVPASVTVEFTPVQDGTLVRKTGGYTTTYFIRMPAALREWANTGQSWTLCPRIVRPTPAHVETGFAWTVHGYQFEMRFDQATIDRLMKKDPALLTQSVDIVFELVGPVPADNKSGCAFLKERQMRALADLLR